MEEKADVCHREKFKSTDHNIMIKAPVPVNEKERLKALIELNILDSPMEKSFDDIVKMASRICETPIALVSLVDENRQWFKAKVGIEETQTPRDISFCGHVVNGQSTLVVKDSTRDERFFDNPAVTGPLKVQFYAGAPLITTCGHSIGTLCVIDHKARSLSEEQITYLEILSKQIITQIELRKKYQELQELSLKVMEQQELLKSQEKLAVIGKLSSGVSHEINNPLAIISGSVLILKSMLQKNDPIENILEQLVRIDQTVTRLSKVGKALRTISVSRHDGFKDAETIEKTFHHLMEEAKKAG